MEPETDPAPRRARARIAFIDSLARQTSAVKELLAWRPSLEDEREAELRSYGADHFFQEVVGMSRSLLFEVAGEERTEHARAWTRQWKIETPWMHAWTVFALLRWDIGRWCTAPACPYGCDLARGDDEIAALQLVLTYERMLMFGEESNQILTAMLMADELSDWQNWLPIHRRPVVPPLPGPHPLLEDQAAFLRRAKSAWDDALTAVTKDGLSLREPRQLEAHCEWLVRRHVLGQTAPQILGRSKGDPSTVYAAVRTVAGLIGLPLRS